MRVLPAYAGMIRPPLRRGPSHARAPRVCGDDTATLPTASILETVLPAYAGMIPYPIGTYVDAPGAPRVCGDDPGGTTKGKERKECSPRMRG